jgi:hypothetical protein
LILFASSLSIFSFQSALRVTPGAQVKVWICFFTILLPIARARPGVAKSSSPTKLASGIDKFAWRISAGENYPYKISIHLGIENQSYFVFFKILTLLQGFPDHAIRRCPGCGRYFFNPTRKFKRFCQSKCMWKVLAKEHRKANREAYNKDQRDPMWRRYQPKTGRRRNVQQLAADIPGVVKTEGEFSPKPTKTHRKPKKA